MDDTKTVWVVAVVIAVGLVVLLGATFFARSFLDLRSEAISGFEECADAGYPVTESYPRQCRDAKGNLFTETAQGAHPLIAERTRLALAETLSLRPESVTIIDAVPREWPDGCLGLGGPTELCTQVIVPGFLVVLDVAKEEYRYRTNADGSVLRAENRPGAFGGGGIVLGQVLLGPQCPTVASGEPCPDTPYETDIRLRRGFPDSIVFRTERTDAEGRFEIQLEPGTYVLDPRGGSPLPTCLQKTVAVEAGRTVSVVLSCDTGVR